AGKVSGGLMVEVGEALVATAIGILVALPAIAAFNMFQRVIKGRLTRAEAMGREVTASYVVSRGIPVELPKGATAEAVPTTLAISIDKDGSAFLDARPIGDGEL